MKNTSILTIFFLLFSLLGCSDDDNTSPKIPSQDIAEGTIQLVFEANENKTIKFEITSESAYQFSVDWGDNVVKEYSPNSPIEYTYNGGENGKKYRITIHAANVNKIILDDETTPNLKEIYFGDLKRITGYDLGNGENNNLEVIDITRCRRFDGGRFTAVINENTKNFNMQGLKNAGEITTYLFTSLDELNCNNLDFKTFSLYLDNVHLIKLNLDNSSNLKNLNLLKHQGFLKDLNTIENINLENLPLEYIRIQSINTKKFDVSTIKTLKELDISYLYSLDETMILPESLTSFSLRLGYVFENQSFFSNLRTVDFSNSSNLQHVTIADCKLLKNVIFKNNNELLTAAVVGSGIEKIQIENSILLKELSLSNCKNLSDLYIRNILSLEMLLTSNTKLSTINTDQLPNTLSWITIENDNFSSQAIEDLFNKVTDEPNGSNKRYININGNPGDNEEVRSLIEKNGNWVVNAKNKSNTTKMSTENEISSTNRITISGSVATK